MKVRTGAVAVTVMLLAIGGYAVLQTSAHSGGMTGVTQKSSSSGCSCHCSTANSATTVTLADSLGTGTLTVGPNTTVSFTATVANSSEAAGGIDIASYSGTGLTAGTGLYLSGSELTHSSPKTFSGGACSWGFTYTTGSSAGWDTLYATGNAVNGDGFNGGGNCTDKWNWSNKMIIHVVVPTKRLALSRSSISLGQIRVGTRKADSLVARSYGDVSITVSSSGMKNGAPFSSYPTNSNRQIQTGTTEMDSVIFTPTTRGTFTDSLIFSTNSDTVPQQHMGAYVTGQAVQAVFGTSGGTSLAFGNLHAGSTSQMTFNFSNSGDDTLFLQTPSISGAGFSIVSGPASLTLLPSQTGAVTVQFAPTAKQSYSGSLSFSASNGVTAPTVSLIGNGTLPQLQASSSASLGTSRVGLTLQGAVTIKNIGNDTMHVSNANLTQPATRFSLGSYDQIILPGATGTFHISYLPNAEKVDTATLHFLTDDPASPSNSIAISASGVLPHMSIAEASDTIDLGQIKVNGSATHDIAVTNNGGFDLNLSYVVGGPAPFSITNKPSIVPAGSTSYITVKFAPTATGVFTGSVTVIGDDASNPSDTIFLVGTGINSALSINPSSADFGPVPVSTIAYDTIVLSNTGSAPVNIAKYTLTNSGTAFSVRDSSAHTISATGSAKIIVGFQPSAVQSYNGSLVLTTDDATTPTRTISLSGRGVKGALTLTPTVVNFGTITIGHDSLIHVGVKNSGQAGITINSVAIQGANANQFSHGTFTTPKTLNAGDSSTIDVTFTPTVDGSAGAMLNFTLADNTTVGVGLQGTGQTVQNNGVSTVSSEFSMTLSPNPAHGALQIHLDLEHATESELSIFDAAGHQVWHEGLGALSEGSHELRFSTKELPSGMYIVRITGADGSSSSSRLDVIR